MVRKLNKIIKCYICNKDIVFDHSKRKYCKNCYIIHRKQYIKQYNKNYKSNWKEKNKEYYKKYCKEYGKKRYNKNKEYFKLQNKIYYKNNKEYFNNKSNEYYKNNELYRLSKICRSRIYEFLKIRNMNKTNSTFNIISCSKIKLKKYLESKFTKGMSWDNQGLWHIDHIIPLSSAKTKEELYKLCHYTNLQPLWAKDNLSKGDKIKW